MPTNMFTRFAHTLLVANRMIMQNRKNPCTRPCFPKLSFSLMVPWNPSRVRSRVGMCTQGKKDKVNMHRQQTIPMDWEYFIAKFKDPEVAFKVC